MILDNDRARYGVKPIRAFCIYGGNIMTLEEFADDAPISADEQAEIQQAIYAIQDAIDALSLEHGQEVVTTAFLIMADAWDTEARAAMN